MSWTLEFIRCTHLYRVCKAHRLRTLRLAPRAFPPASFPVPRRVLPTCRWAAPWGKCLALALAGRPLDSVDARQQPRAWKGAVSWLGEVVHDVELRCRALVWHSGVQRTRHATTDMPKLREPTDTKTRRLRHVYSNNATRRRVLRRSESRGSIGLRSQGYSWTDRTPAGCRGGVVQGRCIKGLANSVAEVVPLPLRLLACLLLATHSGPCDNRADLGGIGEVAGRSDALCLRRRWPGSPWSPVHLQVLRAAYESPAPFPLSWLAPRQSRGCRPAARLLGCSLQSVGSDRTNAFTGARGCLSASVRPSSLVCAP